MAEDVDVCNSIFFSKYSKESAHTLQYYYRKVHTCVCIPGSSLG